MRPYFNSPSAIRHRLLRKRSGVDPFLLQDGPEVLGQAFQDVFVGKPAVAVFAPARAPGVLGDGMPALVLLLRGGIGVVAGDLVEKEARGVGVAAEGLALVIFDDADAGVDGAGEKV